jgi:hypothetical protein
MEKLAERVEIFANQHGYNVRLRGSKAPQSLSKPAGTLAGMFPANPSDAETIAGIIAANGKLTQSAKRTLQYQRLAYINSSVLQNLPLMWMAQNDTPCPQRLPARLSRPIHSIMVIQIMNADYRPRQVGRTDGFIGANEYPGISILNGSFACYYLNALSPGALESFAEVSKQPVIAAFNAHIYLEHTVSTFLLGD